MRPPVYIYIYRIIVGGNTDLKLFTESSNFSMWIWRKRVNMTRLDGIFVPCVISTGRRDYNKKVSEINDEPKSKQEWSWDLLSPRPRYFYVRVSFAYNSYGLRILNDKYLMGPPRNNFANKSTSRAIQNRRFKYIGETIIALRSKSVSGRFCDVPI